MTDASTETGHSPTDKDYVVIVDDNQDVCRDLSIRLQRQLGDRYDVITESSAVSALACLQQVPAESVAVIAVDLSLGTSDEATEGLDLIRAIRRQFRRARILAYTLLVLPEMKEKVEAAGASSYVHTRAVDQVILGVLLQNEFFALERTSPLVSAVVETIGICISIQDADMNVRWTNQNNEEAVGRKDCVGKRCWTWYHDFQHRTRPCRPCAAAQVLDWAKSVEPGVRKSVRKRFESRSFLPINGEICRVEVTASPWFDSQGARLIGVVEATRFTTEQWRLESPAHERFSQVLEAALRMGQHAEDAGPFLAVTVYYGTGEEGDLHRFTDARAEGVEGMPSIIRFQSIHPEYRRAIQERSAVFVRSRQPTKKPSRFASVASTPGGALVLIEVMFDDAPAFRPDGLLLHDLLPYWRYLHEHFDEARKSADEAFTAAAQLAIQEFFAAAAAPTEDNEHNAIVASAVESIRSVLKPPCMHVRILDRGSNALIKVGGFGRYYELAPKIRPLHLNSPGSVVAATTKTEVLGRDVVPAVLASALGRELSAEEQRDLAPVTSYVTLPLISVPRVIGTLSVQFSDDSLLSPAKMAFLRSLAAGLSDQLGRVSWAQEGRAIAQGFRALDEQMLAKDERDELEFDEESIAYRVTKLLLDLTYAEVVAYYRYPNPKARGLVLVEKATQGRVPPGMHVPRLLPEASGVIAEAARSRMGQYVDDYRAPKWELERSQAIRAFSDETERAFVEWITCQTAVPVLVDGDVAGVVAAFGSVRNWLTGADHAVIEESALKLGLALRTRRLLARRRREIESVVAQEALFDAVGLGPSDDAFDRLFLLFVTAREGLQFTRAAVFSKRDGQFLGHLAVGSITHKFAQAGWRRANKISFADKVAHCLRPSPAVQDGDLQTSVMDLNLVVGQETIERLDRGEVVLRRAGEKHVLLSGECQRMVTPEGIDIDYVLVPVRLRGHLAKIIVADRAFLPTSKIDDTTRGQLRLFSSEFVLLGAAISASVGQRTDELAWGVTYAFRTRAAALEAHLDILAKELEPRHAEALAGMRHAVEFFRRGATLASMLLQPVHPDAPEDLRLNEVLRLLAEMPKDRRIEFHPAEGDPKIHAVRTQAENLFWEIIVNARTWIHRDHGHVDVRFQVEGGLAQVHIIDNGPGINPALRPCLFQKFKSYPATSGLGLGLSYAKAIAESHGGTIDEIGQPGKGAHFVVTLPLAKENAHDHTRS